MKAKLKLLISLSYIVFTCCALRANTYFLQSLGGADGPALPFNPDPTANVTQIGPGRYVVDDAGKTATSSAGSMVAADDLVITNCPCCSYPTNGILKWYLQMGSGTEDAVPSLGPDGTVYMPVAESGLWAIDPKLVNTNDPTYPSPNDFTSWVAPTSGFLTPAVGNSGLVYGEISSELCAIATTNGTSLWTFQTCCGFEGQLAISADGTLYVPTINGFVYALTNAPGYTNFYSNTNIYRYGLTNVAIKWVYTNASGEFYNSSPVVGVDGTVYVDGYSGYLYALNPTNGTLKWRTSGTGSGGIGPVIGHDGTIYFAAVTNLSAINPDDGSYKWTVAPSGNGFYFTSVFQFSPAIGPGNVLYVVNTVESPYSLQLLSLNARDGTTNWISSLGPGGDVASPWIRGLVAVASDGEVYAVGAGTVYSFCPSNGATNWLYQTFNQAGLQSPMISPDGTLYVASGGRQEETGYLYAFQIPGALACNADWPEQGKNSRRTGADVPSSARGYLSAPMMTNGGFQFTVNGTADACDCICASTNLTQWDNIGQVWLTNGPQNFMDMGASNFMNRFYVTFPQ